MKHGIVLIGLLATFVVHYGQNSLLVTGPPDDAFCIARREALKLHADRIEVPAGNYQALCPETVFDSKVYWVPASPAEAKPAKRQNHARRNCHRH